MKDKQTDGKTDGQREKTIYRPPSELIVLKSVFTICLFMQWSTLLHKYFSFSFFNLPNPKDFSI